MQYIMQYIMSFFREADSYPLMCERTLPPMSAKTHLPIAEDTTLLLPLSRSLFFFFFSLSLSLFAGWPLWGQHQSFHRFDMLSPSVRSSNPSFELSLCHFQGLGEETWLLPRVCSMVVLLDASAIVLPCSAF